MLLFLFPRYVRAVPPTMFVSMTLVCVHFGVQSRSSAGDDSGRKLMD